jgi:hypothetical protein
VAVIIHHTAAQQSDLAATVDLDGRITPTIDLDICTTTSDRGEYGLQDTYYQGGEARHKPRDWKYGMPRFAC